MVTKPPIVIEPEKKLFNSTINKLQSEIHQRMKGTFVIEPSCVKSLTSTDDSLKEQGEQFICVVCKNFPVPQYEVDGNGILPDTVRLCQCD